MIEYNNKIEEYNNFNFTIVKLDDDTDEKNENKYKISKTIEDEVNDGIEQLKKQSWKYYFYTLFCCK